MLSALGSRQILPGIFAVDQQIEISEPEPARFDGALTLRLEEGVLRVREALARSRIDVPLDLVSVPAARRIAHAAAQRCPA